MYQNLLVEVKLCISDELIKSAQKLHQFFILVRIAERKLDPLLLTLEGMLDCAFQFSVIAQR